MLPPLSREFQSLRICIKALEQQVCKVCYVGSIFAPKSARMGSVVAFFPKIVQHLSQLPWQKPFIE